MLFDLYWNCSGQGSSICCNPRTCIACRSQFRCWSGSGPRLSTCCSPWTGHSCLSQEMCSDSPNPQWFSGWSYPWTMKTSFAGGHLQMMDRTPHEPPLTEGCHRANPDRYHQCAVRLAILLHGTKSGCHNRTSVLSPMTCKKHRPWQRWRREHTSWPPPGRRVWKVVYCS